MHSLLLIVCLFEAVLAQGKDDAPESAGFFASFVGFVQDNPIRTVVFALAIAFIVRKLWGPRNGDGPRYVADPNTPSADVRADDALREARMRQQILLESQTTDRIERIKERKLKQEEEAHQFVETGKRQAPKPTQTLGGTSDQEESRERQDDAHQQVSAMNAAKFKAIEEAKVKKRADDRRARDPSLGESAGGRGPKPTQTLGGTSDQEESRERQDDAHQQVSAMNAAKFKAVEEAKTKKRADDRRARDVAGIGSGESTGEAATRQKPKSDMPADAVRVGYQPPPDPVISEVDSFEIIVKNTRNLAEKLVLSVTKQTTVDELKILIEERDGVPVAKQRLILLGRLLTEGFKTLWDYGLRPGMVLHNAIAN